MDKVETDGVEWFSKNVSIEKIKGGYILYIQGEKELATSFLHLVERLANHFKETSICGYIEKAARFQECVQTLEGI